MPQAKQLRIGHTALNWDPYSDPRHLLNCLEDAAAVGFMGIETGGEQTDLLGEAGRRDLKAATVKSGIVMTCLYHSGNWTDLSSRKELLDNANRWSERVQELGGDMLMVVPGETEEGRSYGWAAFEIMAESMNMAGEIARNNGARCAVHPHWGTVVETRLEIDALLRLLDESLVGFAPDSGQITKGGTNPVDVIGDWGARVRHVHLKDVDSKWPEMRRQGVPLQSPEGYAILGEGIVPLQGFLDAILDTGYDAWIMAELDETSVAPDEVARRHARWLKNYGKDRGGAWDLLKNGDDL